MPSINPHCQSCPLHETAQTVCIAGRGNPDASIYIVGEAPGQQEDRQGVPFVGQSGTLLMRELEGAGISDVYITNLVKCHPPENRAPTKEEIKACRQYLDAELARKPPVLLTLGAPASKAVLRKAKITQDHGQIEEVEGQVRMPLFHPAYILRDPSRLPAFQTDLRRLVDHLAGNLPPEDIDWRVVNRGTIREFLTDLWKASELAFDLETSSLMWYDPGEVIRCVGFACALPEGDRAWVIPMTMPFSPFPTLDLQQMIMDLVFEVVQDEPCVGHNAKFDNLWLETRFGRGFFLGFDTMLAHHTLDENTLHGLKELSRQQLGVPEYDLTPAEKKGQVAPAKLYHYNALDCVYTLRLSRIFRKALLRDRDVRRLFFKLVMPAARAFGRIDRRGHFIRMELFRETQRQVQADLVVKLADLNQRAGREVNWNSPDQVAEVLYSQFKIPCPMLTPKGKPSTSETALVDLKGKHPLVDALLAYREQEKFRSTYLDGWEPLIRGNMIYFSTKLHGTVTGRYSSRLHQVPRDGTIRNLVDAPPGWTFVQADFSQAELRVAAIMSNDPELRECYLKGIDVHWRTLMQAIEIAGADSTYAEPALETATKLAGRPVTFIPEATAVLLAAGPDAATALWKGWKEGRKRAKAINFGFLYGMREKKFIQTAKEKYGFEPTMAEATLYRNGFFSLYRKLPDWHKRQVRLVHLEGWVRNLAGRKRRLPGIYSPDRSLMSEAERQAINSPVQGYIGDHKAMAIVALDEAFDPDTEIRVVGEVHDSILLWVRTGREEELLPRVKELMENPPLVKELQIQLSLPILADLEVGPWGAGKSFKPRSDIPLAT